MLPGVAHVAFVVLPSFIAVVARTVPGKAVSVAGVAVIVDVETGMVAVVGVAVVETAVAGSAAVTIAGIAVMLVSVYIIVDAVAVIVTGVAVIAAGVDLFAAAAAVICGWCCYSKCHCCCHGSPRLAATTAKAAMHWFDRDAV